MRPKFRIPRGLRSGPTGGANMSNLFIHKQLWMYWKRHRAEICLSLGCDVGRDAISCPFVGLKARVWGQKQSAQRRATSRPKRFWRTSAASKSADLGSKASSAGSSTMSRLNSRQRFPTISGVQSRWNCIA